MNPSRWILWRRDPRTGLIETITFTGPLRRKPRGWRVMGRLA